jgi:flagellar basal-body rod modification protein FlgD
MDSAGAQVPAGTYNFSVTAMQGASNVAATALTYGVVNGVTPGATGTSLNVGANGLIPLTQVQQIL